jgi:hypothetical protein
MLVMDSTGLHIGNDIVPDTERSNGPDEDYTQPESTGGTAARDQVEPAAAASESQLGQTEDALGSNDTIHLPELQTTQDFIETLRVAVMEDTGMSEEDILDLRNPGPVDNFVDPSPLLQSVRHFINNVNASHDHYDNTRAIELLNNLNDDFLLFDQVKRRICWLSGVLPIEHDMCLETCMAYTGPHKDLEACPFCSTSRYLPGSKKARQHFTTIPIGPVIQAFYGSCEVAEPMHYLEQKLAENIESARLNGGKLDSYYDTGCGQALLDAWTSGDFKPNDIALQLSIDGAQLRPDQPSEVWIFIWIVHNLPPDMHYKKSFVIPGAIVPGPKRPRDMDSFLFPLLYHVAALQHEGLVIYDAFLDATVHGVTPAVVFATADSPGCASMAGTVGHSGKFGCRLYCDMPGQRWQGDTHYYPVMNQPCEYNVQGCCHADITTGDLHGFCCDLPQKYNENLAFLLASRNPVEYKSRPLNVGLCKQTLLSGLPRQPVPVPNIFTMDILSSTTLASS